MTNFNAVLGMLGGNLYKMFTQKIDTSFKNSDYSYEQVYGLLIEKKDRKFLSKYGLVEGFAGVFLTNKKINTGEFAVFLVKELGNKKQIYQLENEYLEVEGANTAPLIKAFNHNSYKVREVPEQPDFIENYYVEKELKEMDEADEMEKMGDVI